MSQKASAKVVLFIGIKNYFKENCEKSCGITKIILPLHPQSSKHGAIAQLVEQRTENPCVPGSIPGGTTPPFIMPQYFRVERHFFMPKSYNPLKSYPHSSSLIIVYKWREKCG